MASTLKITTKNLVRKRETLMRFHSSICCKKLKERPVRVTRRCYSADSQTHIMKSTYPAIQLPEMPFHEYIFENLGQWEDKVAIDCVATGKKLTYRELYKQSKTLAGSFQKKLKLKKGDRQALILPNCPPYAVLCLVGSMTGVVSTTINPIYTPTEIAYQLDLVQPKVIFTTAHSYKNCIEALNLKKLKINIVVIKSQPDTEIPQGAIAFSELLEDSTPVNYEPVQSDMNDDLVLPFSSGTSGVPKGVQLTHRNITANMEQFNSGNKLKSNPNKETNQSIVLGVLPMFHIYGMVVVAFDTLRCGAKLVILPRFDPKLFVEAVYTRKIEILYLAPPLAFFLANSPMVEPKHLSSVQHVVLGAAPSGPSDAERLRKKNSAINVCQGYGLTETSPILTMAHSDRYHKLSTVGHPVQNTQIKIVDVETGKSLPAGSSGEICAKGPQVMKGYLNMPEETKQTFDSDGWFKTGDIGYYDDEHDLFIVDRLKELIKVKGFQVAPAELEELLRSHPKVNDAGVIGVNHPEFGEVPKAFVVLKEGTTATEQEIEKFISEKLSSYKHLKGGVEFLKAIPKSSAGKILRRELRDLHKKS